MSTACSRSRSTRLWSSPLTFQRPVVQKHQRVRIKLELLFLEQVQRVFEVDKEFADIVIRVEQDLGHLDDARVIALPVRVLESVFVVHPHHLFQVFVFEHLELRAPCRPFLVANCSRIVLISVTMALNSFLGKFTDSIKSDFSSEWNISRISIRTSIIWLCAAYAR